MSYELMLSGRIELIKPTQGFDSGFQKREFVVNTGGEYPQHVAFEVIKDKCDSLDQYQVGQDVTVAFNVRGREYNGNHYVNLQAWKILRDNQQGSGGLNGEQAQAQVQDAIDDNLDFGEDTPF